MIVRTLTVAGLVALLGLVATPNAVAETPLDVAAAEVAILDCRTYSWDSDGDGRAEAWQTCSTPQCGCMCPVVGGTIQLEAAGQENNVAAFGSCQSGYGTSKESSDGSVGIRVTPRINGGGIIAPVEGSGVAVAPLPELPVDAATAVAVLDCRNYSWDYDRDGQAESWQTCSTPQCGCMCPVVGGVVQLEALGQERNVLAFASCQSGYGSSTESEGDGSVGVRVTPIAGGGGLDPVLDTVGSLIALG